jgi:hypothetical protein
MKKTEQPRMGPFRYRPDLPFLSQQNRHKMLQEIGTSDTMGMGDCKLTDLTKAGKMLYLFDKLSYRAKMPCDEQGHFFALGEE